MELLFSQMHRDFWFIHEHLGCFLTWCDVQCTQIYQLSHMQLKILINNSVVKAPQLNWKAASREGSSVSAGFIFNKQKAAYKGMSLLSFCRIIFRQQELAEGTSWIASNFCSLHFNQNECECNAGVNKKRFFLIALRNKIYMEVLIYNFLLIYILI